MPSIFPTQLDQVRDNSDRAAGRYLELMGQPQNSSANILAAIVDRATKANESQLMGDALAAFQKGLENGQKAGDILKTLDPRIAGSKEFQDRAGDIRDDRIKQTAEDRAQAQWTNTLHRQALQDEATLLRAKAIEFYKKTGGLGAGVFLDQNKEALNRNPLAFNQVMDFYNTTGANITYDPNAEGIGTTDNLLKAKSVNEIIDQASKNALSAQNLASYVGIDLNPDTLEALKQQNIDSFIASEGKNRSYSGQDYSDFSENIRDAYAQLKSAVPGLPEWAYLGMLKQNMEAGTWSWIPFAGRFDQDQVDVDTAIDQLRTYREVLEPVASKLELATNLKNKIMQAKQDGTLSKAFADTQAQIKYIQNLLSRGEINSQQANSMLAEAARVRDASYASLLSDSQKLNDIEELENKLRNLKK